MLELTSRFGRRCGRVKAHRTAPELNWDSRVRIDVTVGGKQIRREIEIEIEIESGGVGQREKGPGKTGQTRRKCVLGIVVPERRSHIKRNS